MTQLITQPKAITCHNCCSSFSVCSLSLFAFICFCFLTLPFDFFLVLSASVVPFSLAHSSEYFSISFHPIFFSLSLPRLDLHKINIFCIAFLCLQRCLLCRESELAAVHCQKNRVSVVSKHEQKKVKA